MPPLQNVTASILPLLAETTLDTGAITEKLTIGGAAGLMLWWILNTQTKKMDSMETAIKDQAAAMRELSELLRQHKEQH